VSDDGTQLVPCDDDCFGQPGVKHYHRRYKEGGPPLQPAMEYELEFSQPCDLVAQAFVDAQNDMGDVIKNAENPAFKSKYADLASVLAAVQPALSAHGLAILQGPGTVFGEGSAVTVTVETRLLHKSGQWVRSRLALRPSKTDPQGVGSAITYARRYGAQAMCGVAPEDDDANAASGKGKGAAAVSDTPTAPSTDHIKALWEKAKAYLPPGNEQTPLNVGMWAELMNIAPGVTKRMKNGKRVGFTDPEKFKVVAELEKLIAERGGGDLELIPMNGPSNDVEKPEAPARPESVGIPASANGLIHVMFKKREANLVRWLVGEGIEAPADERAARHAFAAFVLGDPKKGSSSTWTDSEFKRVRDRLELIPPDDAG
jgi:hypothetical protein